MKEYKIKIKNEQHSSEVQTKLFEMGYSWIDGRVVKYTTYPYIHARRDGKLRVTSYKSIYENDYSGECLEI